MYYLLPLLTSLLFLTIGLFVFLQNIKSRANTSFFLLCITTFGWQFSWFILFAFPNVKFISPLIRFGYTFIIFLPITYYHFLVSFLEENKEKTFVFISYLLGIFFLSFLWLSDKLISGHYNFFWGYYPKASILHPFYLILLTILTVKGLNILFKALKLASDRLGHNQIKYVLMALILYIPASSDFIVNYGIEFYPLGFIFIAMSLTTIAYAIVRHQLMDIEVIIKKTLVFASLFAVAFGIFIGITLLTQEILAGGRLLGLAVSTMVIIFAVRPLETVLVNVTNKYLFQKKYDPAELIRTFSKEVLRVIDINVLVHLTVDRLSNIIKIKSCGLLLLSREKRQYELVASVGIDKNWRDISLGLDKNFVLYLDKTKSNLYIQQQEKDSLLSKSIIEETKKLKMELAVPLLMHDEMVGILVLGKKRSDEDYTREDIDVLLLLADALGVALSNAMNFEEIRQKEKLATIGTLAAGIKHDIGTPINKMSSAVQAFLIAREEGDHQKIPIYDVLSNAYDLLTRCQMTFDKVCRISAKFTEYAKPRRNAELELININESVDEALGVLDSTIQALNISIIKNIEKDLPPIMADREYMQQIFVNIIKNAAEAVEDAHRKKDEAIITITAIEQPKKNVHVQITDTGIGIPEDNLNKIFEAFYTTKPEGRGTGLGLAIVKELVERNNGRISARSKIGEGTTLTLEFPGVNNDKQG